MTNSISHMARPALAFVAALSFSAALYGADGKDASPVKSDRPVAKTEVVATPAKPDTPAAKAEEKSAPGVVEKLSRDLKENDAQKLRDEARELDRAGKFEQAIDKFLKAKDIWEDLGGNDVRNQYAKDIAQMKREIAESYYRWALSLIASAQVDANAEKYDEAIEKCEKAMEFYPALKEKATADIQKYKKLKEYQIFKDETKIEAVEPDFEKSQNAIEQDAQRAKLLFKVGRYDESRHIFEEILAKDPYNSTAIEYMRRIYLKMIKAGEKRKDMFAAEALNDVAWKPVAPIMVTGQEESEEVAVQPQEKSNPTQKLREKLLQIKFKSMVFEDTPLSEVIDTLRQRSQEEDLSEGKEGVNFVLRLQGGSAGSSEGEDGESESDDSEESAGEGLATEPSITFLFGEEDSSSESLDGKSEQSVTLLKVIDEICKNNDLNYRVEPYAVVIASKNVPLDDYVTEFYTIDKEALEGDGVCNGDISPETLKAYFEKQQVPFGENASITYDEKTNKLIVTNTPENQMKIADRIRSLNVSNPQVQIQVKFVEVSLNDLEELGFEYTFSRIDNRRINESDLVEVNGSTAVYDEEKGTYTFDVKDQTALLERTRAKASDNSTSATVYNELATSASYTKLKEGQKVVVPVDEEGNTVFYTYAGDRNATHTFEPNDHLVRNAYDDPEAFGLESNAGREDRVFSWTRSDENGYSFNATIHALDQADSSDTLASPRVTTMAGETAVIKMVTEKYYPDSWGDAEMDDVNGRSVFIPSVPEFGDPVEEGVLLEVTPNIADDEKYTLEMDMKPTIQEFGGWTDYSYTVILGDENEPKQNTLKMPIIQARQVETKIICYDKATVTLGGIIKDKVNLVDDQYPILGDIPVIGRLFQSKGQNSEKVNLLIFMTGTMVNSDGTLYRPDEAARGIPRM